MSSSSSSRNMKNVEEIENCAMTVRFVNRQTLINIRLRTVPKLLRCMFSVVTTATTTQNWRIYIWKNSFVWISLTNRFFLVTSAWRTWRELYIQNTNKNVTDVKKMHRCNQFSSRKFLNFFLNFRYYPYQRSYIFHWIIFPTHIPDKSDYRKEPCNILHYP